MRHTGRYAFSLAQLGAAVLLLLGLCASAAALEHDPRKVSGFKSVRVEGAVDLVISQGDSETLTIEGDEDQVSHVVTEVRDGELVIAYKPGWSLWGWFRLPSQAPRGILSAKTLNRIAMVGSGDIHASTLTSQDKLELVIAGSGDIHIDTLAARNLDVRIAGSGDVVLAGAALEQHVRIAGAGDYKAADLKSITTTVSVSGAGDVTVWARDKLDVKISGFGDVRYWGSPVVTRSIAGAGDVKALGARN